MKRQAGDPVPAIRRLSELCPEEGGEDHAFTAKDILGGPQPQRHLPGALELCLTNKVVVVSADATEHLGTLEAEDGGRWGAAAGIGPRWWCTTTEEWGGLPTTELTRHY